MQFRFREYDEKTKSYELIGYVDVQDYDTMFKTLTFMKEHKCEYCIELNKNGIVDSIDCEAYRIKEVSFCFSSFKIAEEEQLAPHFTIDVELAI